MQVNLYFCSCSFSFSNFRLQTRAVDILQTVRRIDFIPPPKVAAFKGGSDEPIAQFQRGDLLGHASQSLLLQLQLQIQQLPASHVWERDPFQRSREETHFCAIERERDVMRWVSPNEEKSSYIYTQRWWVNRCDCWASEPTWVVGRLDNNSIIKINSYLHEYLSESDDLYINPTPLDERNLIKILSAMNKMTHMEFGPSCQF